MPVMERTSISARLPGRLSGLPTSVPMMPSRKPAGIAMIDGFSSGKNAKSAPEISDVSVPDTAGEKMIRMIDVSRPP